MNGDCYWLSCGGLSRDEVAVALAVANSSFALEYYDRCCGNRLYGGRRRFITQYLEALPIPETTRAARRHVVELVEPLLRGDLDADARAATESALDAAVFELSGAQARRAIST